MNKEEIQVLADLSRLKLTEGEIASYQKDFEGILEYIDTLKNIAVEDTQNKKGSLNANYLRSDDVAYSSGQFTEVLLAEAPETEEGFIKVQKIL